MSEKPLEVGEVGVTCNGSRVDGLLANVIAVDMGGKIYNCKRVRKSDYYIVHIPGFRSEDPYGFFSLMLNRLRRITDPDATQSLTTAKEVSA